jgi:outer membrane biogenesis lipoprotein LolB
LILLLKQIIHYRTSASSLVIALLLSGCALLPQQKSIYNALDCNQPKVRCNAGRFAVVWQSDETVEGVREALSGRYSWRSANNNQLAEVELTSVLGPTLAIITASNTRYELKLPDRQIFEGDSWQSLFNLIFPFTVPATTIVDWLNNPSAGMTNLPEAWTWTENNGKYRLNYVNKLNTGRIDLIPDTKTYTPQTKQSAPSTP